MIRIIITVIALASLALAERGLQLYHSHKLAENKVAISCDTGKPTASTMDEYVIVTCK